MVRKTILQSIEQQLTTFAPDTALLHDPNNLQSGGWGHTFKMISPSANDADTSQNPQPTLSSVPPDRINL